MELNKFIDFDGIFNHLYSENKEEIEHSKFYGASDNNLFVFTQYFKNDYQIITEECQFTDNKIIFVYEYNANDANENNNHPTKASYIIIYNRMAEVFENCEYEHS